MKKLLVLVPFLGLSLVSFTTYEKSEGDASDCALIKDLAYDLNRIEGKSDSEAKKLAREAEQNCLNS